MSVGPCGMQLMALGEARGRQPGVRDGRVGRDRRRSGAAPVHFGHARPAPRLTRQHARAKHERTTEEAGGRHAEMHLEQPCTPVERPTANNLSDSPDGHERRELLVMGRRSAATEQLPAAVDGSRHLTSRLDMEATPWSRYRSQATPQHRRLRVARRQRRRPRDPIDRRSPSGRLLPY
jgi:hypothetical protein